MRGQRVALGCRLLALSALVICCAFGSKPVLAAEDAKPPEDLSIRIRVTKVTPSQPININWRTGSEGLSGDRVGGSLVLSEDKGPNMKPGMGDDGGLDAVAEDSLNELLFDTGEKTTIEGEDGKVFLQVGRWSHWNPMSKIRRGFITWTFGGMKTRGLRDLEADFEIAYKGKVIHRFTGYGPNGPTIGTVIPRGGPDDPAWVKNFVDLRTYARRRAEMLESQAWADQRLPTQFTFITDLNGYDEGAGYGIRHTDPTILQYEARVMRQLGVNSLRGGHEDTRRILASDPDYGQYFGRFRESHTLGYPVIPNGLDDGNQIRRSFPEGAGCPYWPGYEERYAEKVDNAVKAMLEHHTGQYEEVWGLTVDEIGSVFDITPEGKPHMSACPHCAEAFRAWLRDDLGMTPADFGRTSWDEVWPNLYPDARLFTEVEAEILAAEAANREEAQGRATTGLATEKVDDATAAELNAIAVLAKQRAAAADTADADDAEDDKPGRQGSGARAIGSIDLDSVNEGDADAAEGQAVAKDEQDEEADQPMTPQERGDELMRYYTQRFNCYASARTFAGLRAAFHEANQAKRQAIAEGRSDSPDANQPWIRSFAMRGCTFISGGHSLDFFNFYREADNAFVYETSNRDYRIWQWDGILNDVSRTLDAERRALGEPDGMPFGIYIKPHRGAPIQRLISAVSRGSEMIFWYTYGPDYAKGDSFSSKDHWLLQVAKGVRLIAPAEDVLYGADFAHEPQVALVRSRSAEKFASAAEWENGKWMWSALRHAHLDVNVIDEDSLASRDLSQYKAIYINGSFLRLDAAEALRQYVQQGGTLVTHGGGLLRDEAKAPLKNMWPVFGLADRSPFEPWATTGRYGATSLRPITPDGPQPPSAARRVLASGDFGGGFDIQMGREVLQPTADAAVLARFEDGKPALVRNSYGKGAAYIAAFYTGFEYAAPLIAEGGNPLEKLQAAALPFVARPALAVTQPVVAASQPTIETVLMEHPDSKKRAITLANWTFSSKYGLVPLEDLTLTVRSDQPIARAHSVALRQDLTLEKRSDNTVVITLPSIEEGDVILLE